MIILIRMESVILALPLNWMQRLKLTNQASEIKSVVSFYSVF